MTVANSPDDVSCPAAAGRTRVSSSATKVVVPTPVSTMNRYDAPDTVASTVTVAHVGSSGSASITSSTVVIPDRSAGGRPTVGC